MRNRAPSTLLRCVLWLFAAQLLACGTCAPTPPTTAGVPSTVEWGVAPDPQQLSGPIPKANLLARSFLPRGVPSPRGYAAYVYLLFADNITDSLDERRVAAEAYLSLFEQVTDVRALGIDPRQMAIVLAPVVSRNAASDLEASGDPDRLVADYDYLRASLLLQDINHASLKGPLPRVSLILTETELGLTDSIYPVDAARIVDLDNASAGTVRRRITKLKNELKNLPIRENPVTYDIVVNFFTAVGCAVLSIQDVATPAGSGNATQTDACGR